MPLEWTAPLIPVGLGLVRSVLGWGENALRDGRVSKFEQKQLVQTIARYVVMAILIYVPLDQWGINNAEWLTGAVVVGLDYLVTALKKIR